MKVKTEYPAADELVMAGPVGCTDVVTNDDYRHLAQGLPPEIARLKAAGRLKEACAACDHALASDPEPAFAACLRAERHRMGRLARQFCVSRAQALSLIRAEWPNFTEDMLDELIARNRIDWRYVEGEQRFLDNFLDSLRKYPNEVPGLLPDAPDDTAARDAMLEQMHKSGTAAYDITLRATIEVPGALPGEVVHAWLPLPAACAQQSAIDVLEATPGVEIAPETALARTAFWSSSEKRKFSVTYRYRSSATYFDLSSAGAAACGNAPDTTSFDEDDLVEEAPHIVFTPYVRAVTEQVVAQATTPLERARAIYEFITGTVDYRFQPAYAQLDAIADSCLKSRRGDCGVFALTFITMCRCAGIPARWQSGLYVSPDYVGPHDWAQFYVDGLGWRWADCSFGSSARRLGEEGRRLHYFGNLDPWRMVANSRFEAELTPPCDGVRWDPFDNQMGEASVAGRGCDDNEMRRTIELVEIRALQ